MDLRIAKSDKWAMSILKKTRVSLGVRQPVLEKTMLGFLIFRVGVVTGHKQASVKNRVGFRRLQHEMLEFPTRFFFRVGDSNTIFTPAHPPRRRRQRAAAAQLAIRCRRRPCHRQAQEASLSLVRGSALGGRNAPCVCSQGDPVLPLQRDPC